MAYVLASMGILTAVYMTLRSIFYTSPNNIADTALLHNSEIRFLMIGLCFHITNFESIFHRLELNVAYNYEKIELCNKAADA